MQDKHKGVYLFYTVHGLINIVTCPLLPHEKIQTLNFPSVKKCVISLTILIYKICDHSKNFITIFNYSPPLLVRQCFSEVCLLCIGLFFIIRCKLFESYLLQLKAMEVSWSYFQQAGLTGQHFMLLCFPVKSNSWFCCHFEFDSLCEGFKRPHLRAHMWRSPTCSQPVSCGLKSFIHVDRSNSFGCQFV